VPSKPTTLSVKQPEPVRFSRLKFMAESPAHYADGVADETSAMRKGSATHAYLLGGASKVVLYEGGARNPKFKAWQEFKAEHPGKHILIPSEMAAVEGMRRSIEAHPRAMELLDDGVQENRIEWSLGARRCGGTPDVVKPIPGRKRLVELKTCMTSKPGRFQWQAKNMFYHAQVAWYAEGLGRTMAYTPGPVDEVYVVAVEQKRPYVVTVYPVTPSVLRAGLKQCHQWLAELEACERSGTFPGYAQADVDWVWDEDGDGLDWERGDEAAA
jgi:hypothetical protein